MMRFVLTFLFICISFNSVQAQIPSWDTTPNDVINLMGEQPLVDYKAEEDSPRRLIFKRMLGGFESIVAFEFKNTAVQDSLQSITYTFTGEYGESVNYAMRYMAIERLFEDSLGPPDESENLWAIKHDLQDPRDLGPAILVGDLMMKSVWDGDKSTVIHITYGQNMEVVHRVFVMSNSYMQSNTQVIQNE